MNSRAQRAFVVTILLIDMVVAGSSTWVAHYIRFRTGWVSFDVYHTWHQYVPLTIIEVILFPIIFAFQRLYVIKRGASRIDELYRIFTAVSIGTVLTMAISSFVFRDFDYSRGVLLIAWFGCIVFGWLARVIQYRIHGFLRSRGIAEERVVLVGTGRAATMIAEKIYGSAHLGYKLVGYVNGKGVEEDTILNGLPFLGTVEEVGEIVRRHGINEVIVADPGLSHQDTLGIVARCEKEKVNIKVFPDVFQIMASEVAIGDLDGLPMVSIRDIALRGWNLAIKRAVDIIVSSCALVIFSPLILFTALLVKLTSPLGPAFYLQERVGLDGKPFRMIKFRSMRVDAEAATGPVWAKEGDPRRTRLGALLRRTSIDEMPQFINVLLGEMSVVGPRPERPHFVEQFSHSVPRYLERHKEKAGITGWAQVNGLRGNVPIEDRTAYDLWYVENWSLWLDIKIMLRTIISVIQDRNAY